VIGLHAQPLAEEDGKCANAILFNTQGAVVTSCMNHWLNTNDAILVAAHELASTILTLPGHLVMLLMRTDITHYIPREITLVLRGSSMLLLLSVAL
jgi:hypothetical protein